MERLRVSVMSVHEGWWYAYLGVFFVQMAAWTGVTGWDEAVRGDHAGVVEYMRAVGQGSSHMVQMFVMSTIVSVETGRLVMVLAQRMADRLKERREQRREKQEKLRAELIAEGMAEGMAKGRSELAFEVAAWNERRLAAEARGESFEEPPPIA